MWYQSLRSRSGSEPQRADDRLPQTAGPPINDKSTPRSFPSGECWERNLVGLLKLQGSTGSRHKGTNLSATSRRLLASRALLTSVFTPVLIIH
jgi:hypothetical protein